MKESGFIKLRIAGQGLKVGQITEKLSQQPSFTYRKGDSYTPKYGSKPIVYNEDCWLLETKKAESCTFDDAINKFLSSFKAASDYLKELSGNVEVTLWISSYPDEEQSNIHLSPDTLKLIADMGISVDLNTMFLKEFYDGTYKE